VIVAVSERIGGNVLKASAVVVLVAISLSGVRAQSSESSKLLAEFTARTGVGLGYIPHPEGSPLVLTEPIPGEVYVWDRVTVSNTSFKAVAAITFAALMDDPASKDGYRVVASAIQSLAAAPLGPGESKELDVRLVPIDRARESARRRGIPTQSAVILAVSSVTFGDGTAWTSDSTTAASGAPAALPDRMRRPVGVCVDRQGWAYSYGFITNGDRAGTFKRCEQNGEWMRVTSKDIGR
jgi:hypothetical protein